MMWNYNFYVYIVTNENHTALYTGVTNDLRRRISEHKSRKTKGFTSKYKCTKLVWYEHYTDINHAISKEKRIKGGSRGKKFNLVDEMNPGWKDLAKDLFEM